MSSVRTTALVVFLAAAVGCSPNEHHVEGRVAYPDGRPLETGDVILECPALKTGGFARITDDGRFRTATPLPAGEYVAYLVGAQRDANAVKSHEVRLVHKRFENPATSGFRVEVGRQPFVEFVVQKP